jgi:glycosyltransferase involved in cell wall biosynthesis
MNNVLVVMIPCLNEQETIGKVIRLIPRKITGISKVKILVLNDGSTDNTVSEANKAKADKVYSHYPNKGLGVTFKKGLEEALGMGADIIVNIDADLQFNPKDIPKIVKPIVDGKADVVTASRFLDKKLEPEMPGIKKFGNKFFTKILSIMLGQNFTDTQCGFRAYSKEASMKTTLFGRFTYTQEVFINLANKGMKIVEVPIKVKGVREHGKSRLGTKWWKYGPKSAMIIIRTLVDSHPLKFFGTIGAITFVVGFFPGLWLFLRWLQTGITSPYGSLVTFSATFMILGFILFVLALLSDLIHRQKVLTEELIYMQKREKYSKTKK